LAPGLAVSSAAAITATKKAGRWPTLFYGSIPSNLGIGREYSHPGSKGKEISQNISGTLAGGHFSYRT